MDYEELINRKLSENNFAKILGIKVTEAEEGYARGEMDVREEHKNVIGSVHGGCIFALADTIAAVAIYHGQLTTTLSGNFNFLSPAIKNKKLIAVAREVKNGRKTNVCDVDILDENDKLLAKGTFTFFKLERQE